jgi:hypothetical protein
MKRLTALVSITSLIFLFTGCSSSTLTEPQSRNEDLSSYTVNDSDDVILEGYINSHHSGNKTVESSELNDLTALTINDCKVELGSTTVDTVSSALNLSCNWDETLNCFTLSSDGVVVLLCSSENSGDSVITGITVCNMLQDFNDLTVEFSGITNSSTSDNAISVLGDTSSYADSDTTTNCQWTWSDDSKNVSYQMIWYNGSISEISLTLE